MKKVYEFYWNCGGMGSVEGVFIADEEEVSSNIGKEVYFGEILGKHSEVYGTLGEEDLTVKTDNQEAVKVIEDIFGITISGYNPMDYIED